MMLTPVDYEARRCAIEDAYRKKLAQIESPHKLWSIVVSFGGASFTRAQVVERLRQQNGACSYKLDSKYLAQTINCELLRMVARRLLRLTKRGHQGYLTGNHYEVLPREYTDELSKVRIERQQVTKLAALEREWKRSPFSRISWKAAAHLDGPEAVVLRARWTGETFKEAGALLGVSRQRAEQLQTRAFKRLNGASAQ